MFSWALDNIDGAVQKETLGKKAPVNGRLRSGRLKLMVAEK